MNNLTKLFMVTALAAGLAACNSTGVAKATFGGPQKAIDTSICARAQTAEPVTVTPENLSLVENKNHGCFGSDNKFCDLRIYQVMVESFKHGATGAPGYGTAWGPSQHKGNIRGIIESLDYIKSVGANAVWLTPVFESLRIDGQDATYDLLDGTGYYTSNYFKIDPKFGTLEDMKELVAKAHAKGMYVIMDGVFGHAKANVSTVSPKGNKLVLSKRCRDWDDYVDKMSLRHGTCFKTQESMEFLKEFAAYWIDELKIDGWRLDQAYQMAPEEWKVIRGVVTKTSAKKSNAYLMNGKKVQPLGFMVGEYWSEKPMALERNGFKNGALPAVMNFPVRATLLRVLATTGEINKKNCAQAASTINQAVKQTKAYSGDGITTMLLGNHDFPRFGDLLQRTGIESDNEKSATYMKAHQEALSFVAASSGPVIVYYGEETGDEKSNFSAKVESGCDKLMLCEDHVSRTDGHVDNLTPAEQELKNATGVMFNLRAQHPALARGNRTHIYSDDTLYVDLKAYKNDKVIYALNNSGADRTITLSADALTKLGLEACSFTNLVTDEKVTGAAFNLPAISGSFYGVECK